MARLIGIGGVFLFADDTERMAQWYRTHLGLDLVRMAGSGEPPTFYVEMYHRDLDQVDVRRHIVFSIMPTDGTLTEPRNQAMINYRVDDLDAFVKALSDAGVECEQPHEEADAEGVGRFVHLRDPEGNRIELWQHLEPEPDDDRVVVAARAHCSARDVWRALVDERDSWWPEMQFEAVVGARLSETWLDGGVECVAVGTVTAVSPPRQLSFDWTEPGWVGGSAQVSITVRDDDTGAIVTVEETGLSAASGDPDLVAAHAHGWADHLARLVDAAQRFQRTDH